MLMHKVNFTQISHIHDKVWLFTKIEYLTHENDSIVKKEFSENLSLLIQPNL